MDHWTEPLHLSVKTSPIEPMTPGGGAWAFTGPDHATHAWWKGAFNTAELDAIIRLGESLAPATARVSGEVIREEIRKSQTSWIFPNPTSAWIFDRLSNVILQANSLHFRFDLSGFYQGLQFTKYEAPGEHYEWHQDRGATVGIRKLSLSLQLSDPDDYDGGELQFLHGKDEETFAKERGLIALFPSWALHRVTPVTRGTRYSLVAWVSGPPFR